MKKTLFLLATVLFMAYNNTQAQNQTVEGPMTIVGTNNTITTGVADTVTFKCTLPSTAKGVTFALTFTGASGNTMSGTLTSYASLDGVTYFLIPNTHAIDTATLVLSTQAMAAVPPAAGGAGSYTYNYTRVVTYPYTFTSQATPYSQTLNANPYKFYMFRYISTSSQSGTVTASGRYLCRRDSAY